MARTPDHIKQATDLILKLRPVYSSLLGFYEKIFSAQEASKSQLNIDPITISEELLETKAKEKFSLISISDFLIDIDVSTALFEKICAITAQANGNLAESADTMKNLMNSNQLNPEKLFSALINNGEDCFEKAASDFNLDKKVLAFITYNSIKPSLTTCAEQLASYLGKDTEWGKGYCPICGSSPGLSVFQGEGERFLICSFCWHKWSAKRIYCPFCDNRNTETLQYFFSEDEEEYRVDICDQCKTYIKTLDTRKTERLIYLPLEQVATLHLDMKAQESGLKSGVNLLL